MKFPCEIIVWNVLPSIRAALAEELIKKGLSQNEVSRMLGITQAAVSQYTSKKRGSKINFLKVAKEEIKKLADDLMDGHVDDLMVRICEICAKVRADKTISILDKYGADDELDRIEYTLYLDKLKRLKRKIAEKEKLLVAFSGGVDSGLLVKVAHDVLGENAFVVILDSDMLPRSELKHAKIFLENLGMSMRYEIIKFPILNNRFFIKNPPNRCYYCKKESSKIFKKIASKEGIEITADGANLSDFDEYQHRPGIKACDEEGIWHPFVDVGITKADIHSISKEIGLPFWDKPSSACLASRIAYGERITKKKLLMVERAEEVLKKNGFNFTQIRVRMHGVIVRIEILKDEMGRTLSLNEKIVKELKKIGFKYVTLDLEGYRSGSMDE